MARMRKENRVIDVQPNLVEAFRREGYDHIDHETGEVIATATGGKSVSIGEYNAVIEELKKAKQTIAEKNEEIKVLEEENIRLDKIVKQRNGNGGNHNK